MTHGVSLIAVRWTNRRFPSLSLKSSTNLSPPTIRTNFIIIDNLDQSLGNEVSLRNNAEYIPPYLSTRVWGRLSAARRDNHLQSLLPIPPFVNQLQLVDTRSSVPGRRWRRSRLIRILEFIIHQLERITLSPAPTNPGLGVRTLADPFLQSLDPAFVVVQDGVPRSRTFLQVLKDLRHAITDVGVLLAE